PPPLTARSPLYDARGARRRVLEMPQDRARHEVLRVRAQHVPAGGQEHQPGPGDGIRELAPAVGRHEHVVLAVKHQRGDAGELARSRWSSARFWAIMPPIETPITCARSTSAASSTQRASATRSAIRSGPLTGSESPVPRLSNTIARWRVAKWGSRRNHMRELP